MEDANASLQAIDAGKLRQYIYIGSDSAYEAASEYLIQDIDQIDPLSANERKGRIKVICNDMNLRSPRGGTLEAMTDHLPDMSSLKKEAKDMYRHLRDKDNYGFRKLQVE